MKPAAFAYHRPRSLEEALALLAEHGDEAKPLAGGQSLVPAMNFRLAQPARLVDLNEIDAMSRVSAMPDGGLLLGAMTRQSVVERDPLVAQYAPLIRETMPFIAHPQIRNRGTFGGSLAHADPAAELPAVMVALEARMRVEGQRGERWVPAAEFYQGLFQTALASGELLTAVAVPALAARSGWAFEEIARRHGDFALVGVAAVVRLDLDGRCESARLALLSVGEGPVLANHAAAVLTGRMPDESIVREAARACAAKDIDPPGDLHATTAYRRHLAEVLTRRALLRAFDRARPSQGANVPSPISPLPSALS